MHWSNVLTYGEVFWISTNEQGKPTRYLQLSLKKYRLKFKASGESPIVSEESMEYI